MREQVLGLLHNRPWLFGVSPHGSISVTGLAREGLVYKRDVITHLYNAFTDGTPSVLVAELDEQVAQPPGIRQVIMVSKKTCIENFPKFPSIKPNCFFSKKVAVSASS